MITPYFPPVPGAGVFRAMRFAKYLPEQGWKPLVIAFDTPGANDSTLEEQLADDLYIRRVMMPGTSSSLAPETDASRRRSMSSSMHLKEMVKRNFVYRAARNAWQLISQSPDKYVSWNQPARLAALDAISREHPDVIFTSGPPQSVHLLGRALKRETKLPWIADFRDPWARRPWGRKASNPWGQMLDPHFEKQCIHMADRVILNTERMADDFRRHYPACRPEHFVCIPNSCDPDLAVIVGNYMKATPRRSNNEELRLLHPGALYRERDPRPIICAIAMLSREGVNVRLDQIGNCDAEFALAEFAEANGVGGRVSIHPPVSHADILAEMANSDIPVLLQPRTPTQVPGKLYEMMLFEKPILGLCHPGETADLISTYNLGIVADPDCPDEIAAAIRKLIAMRSDMKQPNRTTSDQVWRHFDARQHTHQLAGLLQTACENALANSLN